MNFTYIKKADGIVLVYDPSQRDEKIQQNIKFWIDKVEENNDNVKQNNFYWIVANNKSDNLITEETEKIKTNIKDIPIHVINNLKNNDLSGVNVSLY